MTDRYPEDPDQGGFLAASPGKDRVELGQALSALADRLLEEEGEPPAPREIAARLEQIRARGPRSYADSAKLAAISCRDAARAWAARRLPELEIPYRLRDQLTAEEGGKEGGEDRQASLRLVELAEDFLRIVRFCRRIDLVDVSIDRHPAGIAFDIVARGRCEEMALRVVENKGLDIALQRYARENSLKTRFHVEDAQAALHVVVLRPKLRLGLSPVE